MKSRRQQPGDRYRPLLTRARAAEMTALAQLGAARKRVALEAEKLQQLQTYSHPHSTQQQQLQPGTLINRHAFMQRLKDAIRMQQNALGRARQAEDTARQNWIRANSDTRRYHRLIETELRRARLHADRREQKELDEMALRNRRFMHHPVGG